MTDPTSGGCFEMLQRGMFALAGVMLLASLAFEALRTIS